MANALAADIQWDREAEVWIATSNAIPGLCTQADSLRALLTLIKDLAAELLVANEILKQAGLPKEF
ncbi:DUF1902 domain-containing protein [Desulfarculus baarsii]